jgi:hypothetical protein
MQASITQVCRAQSSPLAAKNALLSLQRIPSPHRAHASAATLHSGCVSERIFCQ